MEKTSLILTTQQPAGDILVFLTGREEIDRCLQQISDNMSRCVSLFPRRDCGSHIFPDYHTGRRNSCRWRCIQDCRRSCKWPSSTLLLRALAKSSSAPTSPKLPSPSKGSSTSSTQASSRFVTLLPVALASADPYDSQLRSFNPLTGMDALVTTPCSHASLSQRAGRAGRTSPGKCFRLFPPSILPKLLPTTPPELARSDLSLLVLQLKSLGIQNVLRFDWMTAPSAAMLERALEFLYCLGALDDEGKLTKPLGVRMAEMPVDPMMAKIVRAFLRRGSRDPLLTRVLAARFGELPVLG